MVTGNENDALNIVICNKNPRLVMIDSWFYQDWMPCRIGELVKMTKRQKECLVMLCCRRIPDQIGEVLCISRKTVYNHLNSLYNAFHVGNREEMIVFAWEMESVTPKDIRLYNKKKERLPLPEWAVVKWKCNRFYFD